MPRYDYKCERCGTVREVIATFAETEKKAFYCRNKNCSPTISGGCCRLVRQPSAPAFTISGFSAANGYSGGK